MKKNNETKKYEAPKARVIQVEENSLICTSQTPMSVDDPFSENTEEDW